MRRFGFAAASLVAIALSGACAGTRNNGGGGGTGGSGSGTGGGGSGTGGRSDGAVGTGAGGELSVDANCGFDHFPLEPIPPDVLILLDISQTMENDFNDSMCLGSMCQAKWPAMKMALDTVLKATQSRMRWGIKYFPDPGSALGSDASCNLGPGVQVPIAPNNANAINSNISLIDPDGRTPTRRAINAAAAHLMSLGDQNPKYILLATDGDPNCAPGCVFNVDPTLPQHCAAKDTDGAVAAIAAAAANEIGTFVIGVGSIPSGDMILNRLADAGGHPQPTQTTTDPKYYPAREATDLADTLTTVSGMLVSCRFPLTTPPPVPENIAINVGTTRIQKDTTHVNGWDYSADMMSIQLYGDACQQVKTIAVKDVQVIFGCKDVIIP